LITRVPVTVAVFIDWQNSYKCAREAFGWEEWPSEYGNYSPLRLARVLAEGNGRGRDGGALCRVNIHRGLPSQKYDPEGYAANRRQAAAWMAEEPELVVPRLRSLRYSNEEDVPPREKGIDVELAVCALEWTLKGDCDVAIVFSNDTDLLPAIEAISRLKGTSHVETASWCAEGYERRLRPKPAVYHHEITKELFEWVETRVNYAHRPATGQAPS